MHRTSLAALAVVLLTAGCGEKSGDVAGLSTAPPSNDIILVTIDTWRADAAGFAGNPDVKTPFLDSLAARGIVFTNAHAHNVVTLPSHANILTGLYPYQHGVRENAGFILEERFTTVAEHLKEQGYATGAFIAAFPLDARFGLNQGFDVYDDNYGKGRAAVNLNMLERPAPAVLESASSWWRSVEGRKRFMWIHLYDPHAPYDPPEPFASLHADAAALSKPVRGAKVARLPVSSDEVRRLRYLGEVAAVDYALARYLGPLLTSESTLIVTSDHGEALGDHGELTHGLFAYEPSLKVPLIVVAPGVAPRREAEYVRHIDIFPTLLQRAGIGVPDGLPGRSLLGRLEHDSTYFESLSASLNRGWAPLTGVIRNGTKYIDLPIAELYDLNADPGELNNLYTERRRDVAAARQLLSAMELTPQKNREISAEENAVLRSLGYVSGKSPDRPPTAENDPKNLVHVDNQLHQVIDHFQRDQPHEALRLAQALVAEHPQMASARELLAFLLQHLERVPEAIDVLGQLVADGDASDAARMQLGLLLTETGRPAEAAAILAPLVQRSPNADNLNAYGISLADQGKVREGIEQFRRAIQLDPNSAPAFQNIGIVALRVNDVATAEEYLGRALALNPRLPLALNTLGVLYARKDDFPNAVESWKRAIALDPKQYDALFNVGLVQAQKGDRADARAALERFIRTAPQPRYAAEVRTARGALAALR